MWQKKIKIILPWFIAAAFIFLASLFFSENKVSTPVIEQQVLLGFFSDSKNATSMGFKKEIALQLINRGFFYSYSEINKILKHKEAQKKTGTVNYLAAMALLANAGESSENRNASLLSFFRYFPEIIDDSELFIQIISHIRRNKRKQEKDLIDREIHSAASKLLNNDLGNVHGENEKKSPLLEIFPEFAESTSKEAPTADSIKEDDSLSGDAENNDVS